MDRDTAVARIKQGLGFVSGTSLDTRIVLALQETQRLLEKGKTLPRFLIKYAQPLVFTAGTHETILPADFARVDDQANPYFIPADSAQPLFLEQKFYQDALVAQLRTTSRPRGPQVYVIKRSGFSGTIDFIVTADQTYNLVWNYYRQDSILISNFENFWLAFASEWMIGETGRRLAMDMRDEDAATLFDDMRKEGRSAVFGEDLIRETEGGPVEMGADN